MDTDRTSELNIAQLRTFRQVMQEGGYAAAAKVSHLSVPSIWQHIQALEKAYEVQLFKRCGRQVIPTDAARKLHEQVESILVQLDSTFDTVTQHPAAHAIRMVTGVRMILEDLATPLANFQRQHANPLVLRHGNNRRAEELLLRDEADIALSLEPDLKEISSKIHYEPAYTVEFLAVAKKSHPFAKTIIEEKRPSSLRALARHSLVVSAKGTHGRDALDQAFHREGLTANIVVETDNSAFTIACVRAGMGVGILAGRRDGDLCRKLATLSLNKQLGRRRIVLMWRKGRSLTDSMIDFVEEIKALGQ